MTTLARGALAGLVLALAASLSALPAAAAPPECDRPDAPAMPTGDVVTRSQIEGAHKSLSDYLDKVRAYFSCLEQENKTVAGAAEKAVADYNRAKAAYERLIR